MTRLSAVLSGVPQGTVLGRPLLFLCINDLPRSIKSKVRMYADDTLVYNVINSTNDCIQLQNDLRLLEKWENVLFVMNLLFVHGYINYILK